MHSANYHICTFHLLQILSLKNPYLDYRTSQEHPPTNTAPPISAIDHVRFFDASNDFLWIKSGPDR